MKNYEILRRYKTEVNSEHYRKIHENYIRDYSKLYSKYNVKNHRNSSKFSKEKRDLKYSYLNYHNSVIGFFDNIHDFCCDYDKHTECYYCSVTGRPLNYSEYINCQKKYAFDNCRYSKEYYDNLYKY